MHANQDFLAEMGERFVALDFTAANVELAEIQAERANIARATERAQSRRTEIARERRDFQPDGQGIADALLEGGNAATVIAAQSVDQLSAESDGLAAALRELGNRDRALIERQREVQLACQRQASAEAVPLIAALEADLREAAERVLTLAGGILALRGLGAPRALSEAAEEAANGIAGQGRLMPASVDLPMPRGLAECLAGMTGKGNAFAYVVRPAAGAAPVRTDLRATPWPATDRREMAPMHQ